jgi:polysaccharide deacetylase 2 family uncharacterized protein YibQ
MAKRRKQPSGVPGLWISIAALGGAAFLVAIAFMPQHGLGPVARVALPPPVSHPAPKAQSHPVEDPLADLIEREAALVSVAPPASEYAEIEFSPPVPVLPPEPKAKPVEVTPASPPPKQVAMVTPDPNRQPAWRRNAVPPSPAGSLPMIAIVIDDLGVDKAHTAEIIALPGPLTLSFMTYAEGLASQTAAAHAHGHELMLHVPMEPLARRVDPGPNALLTDLSEDEIRRRFEWGLARIDGITGVNNHMGSRFTAWPEGMRPVMEIVKARGLFFLDSRTTPHSVGMEIAAEDGVPHVGRDVFLDASMTEPEVARELAVTEAVARRNGVAIAIGHPHDVTIAQLRIWLPGVEARGFRLVPVSAVVARSLAGAARLVKDAG